MVSIITPFFKSREYLGACIESVLSQSYSNFEFILVDDGSTDGSLDIALSYRDDRIQVVRQRNQGQCIASNNGISVSSGQYVNFLDSDDLLHPEKTERQVAALRSFPPDTVGICRWSFFHHKPGDGKTRTEPVFRSGESVDWLCDLYSNDTMMHTNCYLIPRSTLKRAGLYFDPQLTMNVDFEFFNRVCLNSNYICYTDEALGYYRKGHESKTSNPSLSQKISALESRVKAIRLLLSVEHSERTVYASRMAITLLAFAYPEIVTHCRVQLSLLGLRGFADFKGRYFKYLTALVGVEGAIRLRRYYYGFL